MAFNIVRVWCASVVDALFSWIENRTNDYSWIGSCLFHSVCGIDCDGLYLSGVVCVLNRSVDLCVSSWCVSVCGFVEPWMTSVRPATHSSSWCDNKFKNWHALYLAAAHRGLHPSLAHPFSLSSKWRIVLHKWLVDGWDESFVCWFVAVNQIFWLLACHSFAMMWYILDSFSVCEIVHLWSLMI